MVGISSMNPQTLPLRRIKKKNESTDSATAHEFEKFGSGIFRRVRDLGSGQGSHIGPEVGI
jgi:hypothetical protein